MSKKKNDWKTREGVVYSTDPDFNFSGSSNPQTTLEAGKQDLRVALDSNGRAGKQVTIVKGFIGSEPALEALGKKLKSSCGVGGSTKNGDILIQGDLREKIVTLLTSFGYKAKRSG